MTDPVVSRLVGELEATGTSAEPGEFTIDEAAALRKLGEHRLADPHDWLCLVVEAASLLDARKITIDSKRGELVVEFDGASAGLEELFGSVFAAGSEPGPSQRARRKLAIALQALVASEDVRQIEITDASGRLVIDPEQVRFEASRATETETELRRTRLHLERRGRGWPELDRVRERCCYASLDILVDGQPAAFGLSHALDSVQDGNDRWPILDGERTIGLYGWRSGFPYPSEVLVVCDGVLAERIPIEGTGDLAIVEGSFRKDLAEGKVLRNESFEHVMELVANHRRPHPPPAEPPVEPVPVEDPTKPSRQAPLWGGLAFSIAMLALFTATMPSDPTPASPKPSRSSKPPPTDALRTADLSAGFTVVLPAVQSCGREHGVAPATPLGFDMWINSRGLVSEVRLASDLADTPLGACVEAALTKATFRSFDDDAMEEPARRLRSQLFTLDIVRIGTEEPWMTERRAELAEQLRELETRPGTQFVHWVLEFG